MSERQLVERECDYCHKTVMFDGAKQNPEQIAEFEQWIMVASVQHDGQGQYVPQLTHYCGKVCGARALQVN